jgi:tRNA threonylcarbamoyladenosine biosynthesis protein TsaE
VPGRVPNSYREQSTLVPASPTPDNREVTYSSNSVPETESIAAGLAAQLRGGECIALHGNLGAGKTQFVRGLVRGLGGPPRAVSSPTFVLLNVYPGGRLTVYHLDAYRVSGSEEFDAIGFPELLEQRGVVVVEWAERVRELLPAGCIEVRITPVGETARTIEIAFPGATCVKRDE